MHDHTGASAAVVHRKEIVGQISLALARLGVKHRIIAPPQAIARIRKGHFRELGRSFIDPNAAAGVISVQTLTSKAAAANVTLQRWVKQITLAVFDEGHHYVTQGLWARSVDVMQNAKLLFVTATPERADGKGLGRNADGFAEVMVEGPCMRWLIEHGYLSPFKYKAPQSDLDTKDIPLTASGDLNVRALRQRVVESHLVGDVVKHYTKFAFGKQAIVFASDVTTADEIAGAYRAAGIAAEALSGKTDAAKRDEKLDDFAEKRLQVLVNVDLFDEGFDVPCVDVVILARPTESLAKYLQMVGRALRVVYAEGPLVTTEDRRNAIAKGPKPYALVLDPVRNWERHGMPNWPRPWTLAASGGNGSGKDEKVAQRVCIGCTQPYEAFYKGCPYCGLLAPSPASRSSVTQVDGDLLELDTDALNSLFLAVRRADMNEDEYELDQIKRGIPSIGRRADMKRHNENRYRRKVLRELVGWWYRLQPKERSEGEKNRRFYHRFGVDVATAFTLKAKDTDELIGRIQRLFHKDMAA